MNCTKLTNNLHLWSSFSLFLLLLVPSYSLNLDGTLLLSFKYSILNDPLSVLDNWDYNDDNPCLWAGVTCAQVENTLRVISLILPNSKLIGTIPEYLGFIQHLKTLDLSNNFLNGTLPTSLFNASELEVLSLSNNGISGEIPLFISGPKNLQLLNLSNNALAGNIPKSLTSLQNLTVVSLRGNSFSGQIPTGIRSFETLDLSSNLLIGSLPVEFGGENLKYLNLSSNKLSGLVPQEFAIKIPTDAIIDLSFNDLSGEIPDSGSLSNQKAESYAGNADLCGKLIKKLCMIPSTLSAQPSILTNTSSPAIAAIPKTIDSNPSTDSSRSTPNGSQITAKHGLKPGVVAGISVGNLAGIGILAAIAFFIYQKKKKAKSATKESSISMANAYEFRKDSDPSMVKETRKIPTWHCLSITNVEETSEATNSDTDESNNFVINQHQQVQNHEEINKERLLLMVDGETELEIETLFKASAYVLGSSSASIVYKAVLQNGTSFAVRRIGESGVEKLKEFENLVKAIDKLRHQNLVRLRGFYWGDDEKLVIYDYISNGSLATIGYRKTGSSPYHLPFETRLKIAKGVARGLNYIHEKKNVHGNIKPSNILLTIDMEPIISDFGLQWLIYGKNNRKVDGPARHFGSKRSTSSNNDLTNESVLQGSPYNGSAGFVGCTSPYHAPESLNNLKPNPKWDVYSFGILLLELLTGKVFSERELSQWTAGSVVEDPNRILRMADVAIRRDVAGREGSMLAWFKLAFSCASLIPQKRPCMKDAIHILEKIPCSSY
ncbi:hypothetical protein RD792_001852 [Penstemon davidsonii]|uniref:Protein kinase domain-containing protein n=1 Tax=Penstemon davidsonii TaxID=160366 RepID=A0ABR0DQP4_9LAMI|nr:hypothetical protein RD792_001852 [Penstemon davidsonii]